MAPHRNEQPTARVGERLARSIAAVALIATSLVITATVAPTASAADPRSVTFEVSGAQGGQSGGGGGIAVGTALLEPGTSVRITVGGVGGFNGGGGTDWAQTGSATSAPGSGGGSSDVRIGGIQLADRALVAGGGGGRGGRWLQTGPAGGAGGGLGDGGAGASEAGSDQGAGCAGAGGTAASGGAGGGCFPWFGNGSGPGGDGSLGQGGNGGRNSTDGGNGGGAGGGGGGGYHGGGGGAGGCCLWPGGGGGGGAGYADMAIMSDTSGSDGAHGGDGRVRVSFDGGTTWSVVFDHTGAPVDWVVPPEPVITSLDPAVGPTEGGTTVTLDGEHLTGTSGVTLCGLPATDVGVSTDTRITFSTPEHELGTCPVVVTVSGAGSSSTPGSFRYFEVPVIDEVAPSGGPLAGGETVTLTGKGLAATTSVVVGGTSVTPDTVTTTSVTFRAPASSAGVRTVQLVTPDDTSNVVDYEYVATPDIDMITPATGPTSGGTEFTLTGSALDDATVTVGGSLATVTAGDDTSITATTPPGAAGAATVEVVTLGGNDTATFTYHHVPGVTGIGPGSGPAAGGTAVTIEGSGFTGATAVLIGDTPATAVVVVGDTAITAVTPALDAGTHPVRVQNADSSGTTVASFVAIPAPSIEDLEPGVIDPAGDEIIISGHDLTGATTVRINGTDATDFVVVDDTTITAVTPAVDLGEVVISVVTPGGSDAVTTAAYPTPSIASIDPPAGPADEQHSVTISGSGFTGVDDVRIGTRAATDVVIVDDHEMRVVVPEGPVGTATVVVSNPGLSSNAVSFVRMAQPRIELSSFFAAPGDQIEIGAEGFAPGSDVQIWINSTPQLLATAGADSAGRVTASVTLPEDLLGNHRIRAVGADALGSPIDVSAPLFLSVDPPGVTGPHDAAPATLAFTGSTTVTTALVAMVVLLVGFLLAAAPGGRSRRIARSRLSSR